MKVEIKTQYQFESYNRPDCGFGTLKIHRKVSRVWDLRFSVILRSVQR